MFNKEAMSQFCSAPPISPGTHVSVDPPTFQWYVAIAGSCGPVYLAATTECPINSTTPPPPFGSFPLRDTCFLMSNSQWGTIFSLNTQYCWGTHVVNGGYIWQTGGFPIIRLAAVLPPVSLSFPSNADTQISITPRIVWNRIDSANSYTIRLYSDACCITVVFDSTTAADAVTVPLGRLMGNSRYYYRVKSYKAGGEGPFSDPFYFTTWSGQIPNLESPQINSEGVQLTPTLDWDDILNPLEYRVQVSTDINFSSIIVDNGGLTLSQYSIPGGSLTYNSVYYWRAASRTASGWSPFSKGWNFKTFSTPDPVILGYPVNNGIEVPTSLTFTWYRANETLLKAKVLKNSKDISTTAGLIGKRKEIDAINKYWFELTTDTVTLENLVTDNNITDTSKFISGLSLAKDYYWRVKANNELGWGPFSNWRKFTTVIGPPQAPVRISPQNNSFQQFLNLPFIWNKSVEITAKPIAGDFNNLFSNNSMQQSGDAISAYWFELTEDTISMTGLIRDTTLTDTTKTISLSVNSKSYYWRIKAKNDMGWGVFTSWWKFITLPAEYGWSLAAANISNDLNSISFVDQWYGWATNNNLIYKTSDGGSNWYVVSNELGMTANAICFTDQNNGRVASRGGGSWNYPWWSTGNGGVNWFPELYMDYQSSNFVSIDQTPEGIWQVGTITTKGTIQITYPAIIAAGINHLLPQNIGLNRVRGGKNNAWIVGNQGLIYRSLTQLYVGEDVNLTGVSFNDDNTGYVVGGSKMFKSTNNGSNWFRLYPLTDQTTYNDVYFANKDTGWVACSLAGEGVIIGTTNGGASWALQYKGQYAGSEFSFVNNSQGWLLCGNSVLRTHYGGSPQINPPVLFFPANGALAVEVTPMLDWEDKFEAINYRVQISNDSLFTTILLDDSSLVQSNYNVQAGLLSNFTVYYWRVAAKNSESWSSFSAPWYFRTYGIPGQVFLNSPLNNSVNQSTELTFIWTGAIQTLSKYDFESKDKRMSIASDKMKEINTIDSYWFEATTDTNTFSWIFKDSTLTDTANTITGFYYTTNYYWRVKAHNDQGWGAFSSWWKFTTTNGIPVLLTPSHMQWEIPVTPLLDWSDVLDAQKYQLQVSAYGNFSILWIDDSSSTVSEFQVTPSNMLAYNSGFYWRVRAKNHADWGNYQTPFRFFTRIIPPPPVPVLNLPLDGATGVSLTPQLDWSDVSGITKYRLQVGLDTGFSSLIIDDSSVTESQFSISQGALLTNTVYYWRVSAKNTMYWSEFSNKWNFRTISSPLQVVLSSPVNNATGQMLNIDFMWYKASEQLSLVFLNKTSEIKKISNDVTINNERSKSDAIEKYQFELTTDTITLAGLVLDSTLTDTVKSISGLNELTSYYWRVKAKNEIGWGTYSTWWKFTTFSSMPPAAPVLISPPDFSLAEYLNLQFTWNRAADIAANPVSNNSTKILSKKSSFSKGDAITAYWFELTDDTVSFTGIVRDSSLTDTTNFLNLSVNSKTYYWRVKAKNEIGWGVFSSWWKFITVPVEYDWETAAINIGNGISSISFPNSLTGFLVSNNSGTAITYKTTDGGSSWENISVTSIMLPNSVVFTSPTEGYIASGPHGSMFNYPIWSSVNGGIYWDPVAFTNYGGSNMRSVASTVQGIIHVGTLTTLGTIQNTYSAIIGIEADPLLYHTIPLNRVRGGKNNAWTVGDQGLVYRSMTQLNVGENVNLTGISFNDDNTGYVVGGNKIYKSTNTGSVFFRVYPLSEQTTYNDVYFANKDTGWVACSLAGEGVIIGTTNGGASWALQYKGSFAGSEFTFVENKFGWLLCGNSVLRTTNVAGQQILPPVLLQPSDGATAQTLIPQLDWQDALNALKYRVQLSTDSLFANLLIDDSSITNSTYAVQSGVLQNYTQYYWRVAAKNSSAWSNFSQSFKFRTYGTPAEVVLNSPANNAAGQSTNIIFSWFGAIQTLSKAKFTNKDQDVITFSGSKNEIDAIDSYWFEATTDTNTFSWIFKDSTLTDTANTITGFYYNTNYYWRVKAHNDQGWGAFSSWWKFTTTNGIPVLLAPSHMQWEVPVTPLLDWSDVLDAQKYHLQVSAFSNFSILWIDDSSSITSQYQVPNEKLAYNSGYFWRVRAKNQAGWGSYQASPFRFFTQIIPPPPVPVLNLPLNGATGVTLTPQLDWSDVSGITKYRLQVGLDTGFSSLIIDDSSVTESQFSIPQGALLTNTIYYWRISAKNTMYWSEFTNKWNFRTISSPLQVVLSSPANNATGQMLNIDFTWYKASEQLSLVFLNKTSEIKKISNDVTINNERSKSDAIEKYQFELTTDTITLAGLVLDSTLTDTVKSISGLNGLTSYYWRAKAKNETGWGSYSTWWKFTTFSGVPPAAPVLLLPLHLQWEIPVTPLLNWSDVPEAQKYHVQVSAYGNFSILWINDSSSTVSQYQVPNGMLAYNSGYYWRVRAKNDAGWGNYQVSPFRFFTQIIPPPPVPVLNVPLNEATGITLTPLLEWIDVTGSTKYRLQVGLDTGFSTLIIDDSSITNSQFIIPAGNLTINTIYYWRVAARNTMYWSEFSNTWNFMTIGSPLQVLLSSPANNATEQLLNINFTWFKASEQLFSIFLNKSSESKKISNDVFKNNVKFSSDAIDKYQFELTTDTITLAGLVLDSTLTDTVKSINGLNSLTVYYWRVKAKNETGWGSYGDWWKFTTYSGLPPAAPVLLAPTHLQWEIPVTPLLDWSDVPGAQKYHVQVSAYGNFSILWINDSSSTNSQLQVLPNLLAYNSGYYWRVRAKNEAGWGNYQATPFRFFTKIFPPPPVPQLTAPLNNSVGISLTPLLDWNNVSGSTKYRLQAALDTGFNNLIINDSSFVNSEFIIPAGTLSINTIYYWRVAAKNTMYWSEFSGRWNFKTIDNPQKVTLVYPPNNSIEQPLNITFSWMQAEELIDKTVPRQKFTGSGLGNKIFKEIDGNDAISTYWFELVTDTITLAGLIKDTTLTDTTRPVTGLNVLTVYYWRVKGKNDAGWGTFSDWWKFTTYSGIPPAAPVLISPANMQWEIPVTPLLNWSDVTGSQKYHVQVSAYGNFSILWINDSSSTVSQYQVPNGMLAYNSGYYWRVRAKNDAGWGNYQASVFRFFTRIFPPPPVPVLNLPLNGGTGVTLTPQLDWTDVGGSTKYRLQAAIDTGFNSLIINDSSIVNSEYNIPAGTLSNSTIYYWRVAVKNTMYWSEFSNRWNFKTIGVPQIVISVNPSNNSIEQPLNITFSWMKALDILDKQDLKFKNSGSVKGNKLFGVNENIDAISSYWFELTTDTNTLAGLVKDTTLTDTTKYVSGLNVFTIYYWRVKAKNEIGWGTFSNWWKFTTISGQLPSVPVLLSPSHMQWEIPVTPLLNWSDVPGAQKYHVQVSAFSNFSILWINDSSSTSSQFQVPNGMLAYNSGYFWHVRAKNDAGWGNYQASPFRFFTLITPPEAPPGISSKVNNEINLSGLAEMFKGNKTEKYSIELCKDTMFEDNILKIDNIASENYSFPIESLDEYSTYFWRISANGSMKDNYETRVFVTYETKLSRQFPPEKNAVIPEKYALYQNYPNPFNPDCRIKFDIPKTGDLKTDFVKLVIYDLLGKEVAIPVNGNYEPGSYEITWNAANYPSGIYIYQIRTSIFTDTKKMVLLK